MESIGIIGASGHVAGACHGGFFRVANSPLRSRAATPIPGPCTGPQSDPATRRRGAGDLHP